MSEPSRCAAPLTLRVTCVIDPSAPVGLDVVDRLARLRLAAVREGATLRVCGAGARLRELLTLAGLAELLLDD